jgi:peptidoglycan-N-acetylglucosamine deacetylase
MRLFRPRFIADWLYPEAIFRIKTDKKILCLTFDDGPHPDSTPVLLDILDRYNIKVLFFCDGRAAEKYPGLAELIESKGHVIGNHGFMHLDGWRTSTKKYVDGKYNIVLWDLMPYDFDKNFGSERSLHLLKKKIRPGSIIIFHDKPFSSAILTLPGFIDFAIDNGYKFADPAFIEKT